MLERQKEGKHARFEYLGASSAKSMNRRGIFNLSCVSEVDGGSRGVKTVYHRNIER